MCSRLYKDLVPARAANDLKIEPCFLFDQGKVIGGQPLILAILIEVLDRRKIRIWSDGDHWVRRDPRPLLRGQPGRRVVPHNRNGEGPDKYKEKKEVGKACRRTAP